MSEPNGYKQLQNLFSTASTLPQLPGAALKLIQILDDEEVSSTEVERIIMGDPALTAAVIRAASSALYGGKDEGTTTVRGAINRLGHRAVQSVAVSLGVQALMSQSNACPSFDRTRFARHCIFVGFLSRYLYACRAQRNPFRSKYSRDEVFAAGVLHDLAVGLLARVDPSAFERVYRVAKKCQCGFQSAFQSVFGQPINDLAIIACETWGLPNLFKDIVGHYDEPSEKEEFVSLCCVHYANFLADENSHGIAPWIVAPRLEPEILDAVGLPEEDIPGVIMLVARHTAAYVPLAHAA